MLPSVSLWAFFLIFPNESIAMNSNKMIHSISNNSRRKRKCSGAVGTTSFCHNMNDVRCCPDQQQRKIKYTFFGIDDHHAFHRFGGAANMAATAITPICLHLSYNKDDDNGDDDTARSQFGTRQYWDDTYNGYGDFPMEEYSWYYGWEVLKPYVKEHCNRKDSKMLLPGIGNDPILLDLLGAGYTDITAFDYTESSIERQEDLLSYVPGSLHNHHHSEYGDENEEKEGKVKLFVRDARKLDDQWTDGFDFILEKGTLDAVYLSGDGNVEQAVSEMKRVLKKQNGIFISVSGVVPYELRKELFPVTEWEWLRDGSEDLKAGCFIWRLR
mmetsp:Transcript_23121/g.33967  ORF Transcript_23121/g.33967 Transcript_23121/m.33967 type:complete len:327 (-) Transcript_23121:1068-2048(-)